VYIHFLGQVVLVYEISDKIALHFNVPAAYAARLSQENQGNAPEF
jgi:hypothetical protein